jgi:hypothetical protein
MCEAVSQSVVRQLARGVLARLAQGAGGWSFVLVTTRGRVCGDDCNTHALY